MSEQQIVESSPAHPNAGILLRQIFDFSDITRSEYHAAVKNRSAPVLSLLLSLSAVGMSSPPCVVLPGGVPLSLMVATFTRGVGPTTGVASSIDNADLEKYGELVLNPETTYVITGAVADGAKQDAPVWIHANQPIRGIVRGHGLLHRIWMEGTGSPPRSHFVTCECYGDFLRRFLSLGRGRIAELFVMSFPSWDCPPDEVQVPVPEEEFTAPEAPRPANGVGLCSQALSALEVGLRGSWNPALVNRVKIAALAALLHGEDYVTEDLWRWAGLVLTHSERSKRVAEWVVERQALRDAENGEAARR